MATLLPFRSLFLILSARRQTMATFARHLALHKLWAAAGRGGRVYDSLKPCCMTHNIAIGKTSALPLSHSPFPLSKPSISRRRRIACNYFYDFIQRQLTLQFVSGSSVRERRGEERGLPFDAPFPSFYDDDDFYGSRVTQLVILLSNCYETTDGPPFLRRCRLLQGAERRNERTNVLSDHSMSTGWIHSAASSEAFVPPNINSAKKSVHHARRSMPTVRANE